ncbi:aminotransferase family protein [Ophiostoma piceae UAMH 11346]|uniref:Aminotransferase family protein n=1 Tax=Ophiostoma piceae (strain UAMH 11346) TaxID=1262450 RepID=S3C040_OPHP1|nr:aminotransferase family protein [Ophiostoma piceae UAMH 11346]
MTAPTPFGKPMRELFPFAPTYRNINHGSYGTYPTAVRDARFQLLNDHEARAEIYKRLSIPPLLTKAREALLPLLGPDVSLDEVVIVPNATTGVNTVLQNVSAKWSAPAPDAGDAVLYFTPIYGACGKTLQYLGQVGRLHPVEVHVTFPQDDDDAVVQKLRDAYAAATARGLKVRMALFDTIVSAPGVLLPWERLTEACRELGILSLVDGAHGIGHIDLTHLGKVSPDFFVSNVHKWLFTPRGCAVFYVPLRNQHYIDTSLPTSWGYELPADRNKMAPKPSVVAPPSTYFVDLFGDVGTMDYSQWLCIPTAVKFRKEVCGGEEAIRTYCIDLVRKGSERVAAILGTEVMDNPRSNMRQCAMANVRLPFSVLPAAEIAADDATTVSVEKFEPMLGWLTKYSYDKFDTYFRITYYEGHPWVRVSAQVYLDEEDFEWAGQTLKALVDVVMTGAWKAEV